MDCTNKVDIWALGCILYELRTGSKPFSSYAAVFCYYQGDSTATVPIPLDDGESRSCIDGLINQMLAIDPSIRPTADHLLSEISYISSHFVGDSPRLKNERFPQAPTTSLGSLVSTNVPKRQSAASVSGDAKSSNLMNLNVKNDVNEDAHISGKDVSNDRKRKDLGVSGPLKVAGNIRRLFRVAWRKSRTT